MSNISIKLNHCHMSEIYTVHYPVNDHEAKRVWVDVVLWRAHSYVHVHWTVKPLSNGTQWTYRQ